LELIFHVFFYADCPASLVWIIDKKIASSSAGYFA